MADYEAVAQAGLVDALMSALHNQDEVHVIVDGIPDRLEVKDAVHSGTTMTIVASDRCRYHFATKSLRAVAVPQKATESPFEYRSAPEPRYT